MRRLGLPLLGAGVAILLAWALLPRPSGSAEAEMDAGEEFLRARFLEWKGRVERAAARLAALPDAPPRDQFEAAAAIVDAERVDGVAIVDSGNRARVWAGRTFDADPRTDFSGVARGVEVVRVLDVPAHRVLFAARAAGEEIAVAYLAFDERFPSPRDFAAEAAAAAGLA
ncbi:MAG: hypothetical protein L6Q95_16220, partial [Planctomycetes bacterium]|nr:hypothetical protein [Planctomycetota bacterium]